ncbi:ABC transporter thiamine pyrophosphate-binding lipoprotein p37/Cypl [Mycoplasmopsis sturni]|uniref:ABC transporter thiamine pyrophosphate-binding lipoprotein p37/Cypl n=1 Tax=Mycoplasmopsis sturni TaxID=39047 RepID=UPI000560233E|nr:hypothetical protein [Mycoplasmopsis sturni]
MYKWLWKLMPLLIPVVSFSASCTPENKQTQNWDSELTLMWTPTNPGSFSEKEQKDFLELLSTKFNQIKNSKPNLNSKPNVKFNFNIVGDPSKYYGTFESGNDKNDFILLNYKYLLSKKQDELLPAVSQTQTLNFIWNNNDVIYKNDDINLINKLFLAAQKENELQLENPQIGNYPVDWVKPEIKKILSYDGGKYSYFYQKASQSNSFTDSYRGAILIAGNKETRDEITKAWLNKDWEAFRKFGIIFEKENSISKYSLPRNLLSLNFGKSIQEIDTYLKNNTEDVVKGKKPRDLLGILQSNKKTFNIAFDDEGVFNWTKAEKQLFKPTNYPDSQVRVLTFTDSLKYPVILARNYLNLEQVEIMKEVLSSLTYDENTYGLYSGFNQFKNLSNQELFSEIQKEKELLQR